MLSLKTSKISKFSVELLLRQAFGNYCLNDRKWDGKQFIAYDLCRPQTGRLTFTLSPPSPTHPYTIHMFIVYTSQVKGTSCLGAVAVRHQAVSLKK